MYGEAINIDIDYLLVLLLVDSAAMVYVGYYDLKKIEFNILVLPPLLVVPLFLYYIFWGFPMFPIFAVIINALFLAVIVLGYMGTMDLAVSARIPLLLPLMFILNPAPLLAGFILGTALSYLYFLYKYIKPILCPGARLFSTVTKVKKDAFILNYVMPPNIPMDIDSEKLSKIKEKILKSKNDCVDATVGVPYLFIFSIGYAIGLLATVTVLLL